MKWKDQHSDWIFVTGCTTCCQLMVQPGIHFPSNYDIIRSVWIWMQSPLFVYIAYMSKSWADKHQFNPQNDIKSIRWTPPCSSGLHISHVRTYELNDTEINLWMCKHSWTKIQHIPRKMHTVQICCVLLWGDIDWFTYILQLQFAGIGIIIWLPQCQWINAEEYGQTDHMNILRTDIYTTIKQYTNSVHILWEIL